jgi:hypothetical protein
MKLNDPNLVSKNTMVRNYLLRAVAKTAGNLSVAVMEREEARSDSVTVRDALPMVFGTGEAEIDIPGPYRKGTCLCSFSASVLVVISPTLRIQRLKAIGWFEDHDSSPGFRS